MNKNLTKEEKNAACIMSMFVVLNKPDDAWWFEYCTDNYAKKQTRKNHQLLEACVWWAMRYADTGPDLENDFIEYLEHVCRNKGYLEK